MGWLSLCVCGTKGKPHDEKKNEKCKRECDKKSKRSKRYSKQKGSHKAPSSPVFDESSRKSQDGQLVEKEVAEKEWTNEDAVNYIDNCTKIDGIRQIDPTDDSSNDRWSCQADENLDDEFPEKSADESDRETCGIDYDNAALYPRCASSATDEEKQVKCAPDDEEEPDVEADLDVSASRSAIPGELEDAFRTSEVDKDKQDAADVETNFARQFKERTSSRINFSSKKQGRPKAGVKELRRILPPIKRRPCADTRNPRVDSEQVRADEGTNKFGFKRTAVFCEQAEIRRKLNSCSFEVRSSEDEERGVGKARTPTERSMIPRLASPLRQGTNSIKSDSDRSEFAQNGISRCA